eukprot:4530428-Pyramimonas_sp.AAC.1
MSVFRKWRLDTAMLQPAELFAWAPRPSRSGPMYGVGCPQGGAGAGSALAYLGAYVHRDLYGTARVGDVVETPWNSLERKL